MKIRSIEARHFRGLPGKTRLGFEHPRTGEPISLVLTGDNGTGKSSFVDALEFGLQGLIGVSDATSHLKPSLVSFAGTELPSVSVTLEDGSAFSRRVVRDDGELRVSEIRPHPSFSVSPFVLRRKDILRFQDAPESERVLVFWNYLREPRAGLWEEPPDQQLRRLQVERLSAKERREQARTALAEALGVEADEIPHDRREFHAYVKEKVYGGFSPSELRIRGVTIRADPHREVLVKEVISAADQHTRLKKALSEFELTPPESRFPKHLLSEMNGFLSGVAPRLSGSFTRISSGRFVEAVELSYGELGDLVLQIRLRLSNGAICRPGAILSEANLDLLALLFFISVAQESAERGQAKFLVLDDVLQSVDSTIRVAFLDYLLEEMSDWQVFLTVHDRLWKEQVKALLNRRGHAHSEMEITEWSFEGGPILRGHDPTPGADLTSSMTDGTAAQMVGDAGRLLEMLCHHLSIGLPISVKRRPGDKYTLGDLWPGVVKTLKKTEAGETILTVDRMVHLRNLVGAHFNEWAATASRSEAKEFSEAVMVLFSQVYCARCAEWITLVDPPGSRWSCRCGGASLSRLA